VSGFQIYFTAFFTIFFSSSSLVSLPPADDNPTPASCYSSMSKPANQNPQPPGNTTVVLTTDSQSDTPAMAASTPASHVAASGARLNPFDPHHALHDNQHDPLYLVAPQTWAQRNPTINVQNERLRAKPTDAIKATRKLTTARNKANTKLLSASIEEYMEQQQTQIEKLALDHNRNVSEIEKIINNRTNYRSSRGPLLSNALTHKKGMELNDGEAHRLCIRLTLMDLCAGREVGDKATLSVIQQAKDDDPFYQNMDAEDKKKAIDELMAYRAGKSSNTRATNKGAACDVFVTMDRIEKEVHLLGLLYIYIPAD
jgi:hypothetical protein